MLTIKYDLGLRSLLPEWKMLFSPKYLREDCIAGITVACIAIPLSLAIALASGVAPVVGLVTAIVGAIVCALFGGTPLSVSGPAAAMSVLIASNVEQFGLSGLLCIGIVCGLLQILSGVFGIGTLMKFVPVPVIGGFTAGIGAIILIGQLPRAFDLPPPEQSHILNVITHIGNLFTDIKLEAVVLTLISFLIIHFLPKFYSKLPAPLIAIAIPTLILYFFPSKEIDVIGEIPRSFPLPNFPKFEFGHLPALITAGISVYFLASLETLLSSSAVDKMVKVHKHDSNQELIGQGFGNIASAVFGGIPVTGVIARTALNINSGAKTRRASIMHALILIGCIFTFAPLIQHIPLPALAGVLISVAFRMLDFKSFFSLFQISKSDGYIFIITFGTILFADLLVGVQTGLIAAGLIALVKIGHPNIFIDKLRAQSFTNTIRCSIDGPLTFVSIGKVDKIEKQLAQIKPQQTVIIDMSQVINMDITGAAALIDLMTTLQTKQVNVILKGVSQTHEKLLSENCESKKIPAQIVNDEPDILALNGHQGDLKSVIARLIHGAEIFQNHLCERNHSLFQNLAIKQNPHTLFVGCADSRLSPNLITSTEPGELFVVRNVGNVIPPFDEKEKHSEYAAIEFALNHLKVKTIVICGHSNCGAIDAAYKYQKNQNSVLKPSLLEWIKYIYVDTMRQCDHVGMAQAVKDNALAQTKRLLDYPIVAEKLEKRELTVFTWFYDIGQSQVQIFDASTKMFVNIADFHNQELS